MSGAMFTLLALLAAPAAAQSSPPPAPCELKGIPRTDLVKLRVAMVEQLTAGTPRPASAAATLKTIETKAAACNPGGDLAADKAASDLAIARFTADTIAEKLAADGVERAKIDVAISETEPSVLDALVAKRFEAPGVSALADRVTAAAGESPSEQTRKLLGAYTFHAARVARGGAVKRSGPVER